MKRQLSGAANEREKRKLKKLGELSSPKICKLAKNLENVLLGETKCWSCHYKKCQKMQENNIWSSYKAIGFQIA